MSKSKDEEFILMEIAPWFWNFMTEEQREDHRRLNPMFVPRVVEIAKEKKRPKKAK